MNRFTLLSILVPLSLSAHASGGLNRLMGSGFNISSTINADAQATTDEPSLTISPTTFGMAKGYVGKSIVIDTLHVSAINLPSTATIDMIGSNRDLFSLSTTNIDAGTSDTDVYITYSPTAIGKHTATISIDCPTMPTLAQTIRISAYAIDEANPPTVTVSPNPVPAFSALSGETQEQTISVNMANMPDYTYAKMRKAGDFRLSTSMLYPKNGATQVKITFSPLAAGTYDNEILFYSLGLPGDTVCVAITGTATEKAVEPEKEGDSLLLDTAKPLKLLVETFDNIVKNKPLNITDWNNVALEGTRAWWGYEFPEDDESAGEKAAKVTPYDSKMALGQETPCTMMLITPALDFKNAESKIFTFRVRGNYLSDEMTDKLELVYIDTTDSDTYISPVGGFTMPATADDNGVWQEFHVDLTGQELADVFFMGFRFTSSRGISNSATYYIDDVSYGRTDLAVIRPMVTSLDFEAYLSKNTVSETVYVEATNLAEPIKLSLGGVNKSKFKLSTNELPTTGGSFNLTFNSDNEGVHEAYVRLSSRGAADKYIPVTVKNSLPESISSIEATTERGEVVDLAGRKVAFGNKDLPAGIYIVRQQTANGVKSVKARVR